MRLGGYGDLRTLVVWPSLSDAHRQLLEACLAILCLDVREETDPTVPFEEIRLRGRPLAPVADYEQVFECAVRFG